MRPSVARALLRSAQAPRRASWRGAAPLRWQPREALGPHCMLSACRAGGKAAYSTRDTPPDPASEPAGSQTIPNTHWRTTLPFEFPPEFGFAFDIDGVLLRSSEPVPGAAESIQFLLDNNIPFALLTNGGGVHEAEKAVDVGAKLGVTIPGHCVVLSHTPFQKLVYKAELEHLNVFVTGSDPERCREIAESYGFKSVITPADILKDAPDYFPHDPMLGPDWRATAQPLPRPVYRGDPLDDPELHLKIDAVLVFNEPRDWALNIQIITDLMLSKQGFLGTTSPRNGRKDLPNSGFLHHSQPQIYLANPDLIWSTAWHQPRLGMGAFNQALKTVWQELSRGAEWTPIQFGKPYEAAYAQAEEVLVDERHDQFVKMRYLPSTNLERAYMVGDNPQSDIRGANQFKSKNGTLWNSVLTCTGLMERYNRKYGEPLPPPKTLQNPSAIVNDVREAVRWALMNEGIDVRGKL